MLDTKALTGEMKFLVTHVGKSSTSSRTRATNLARFTACCRHDHHLRAIGDIAGEGTACAKALIVWVGEDPKNAFRLLHGIIPLQKKILRSSLFLLYTSGQSSSSTPQSRWQLVFHGEDIHKGLRKL
jgi:hypothetical protein